ncbi:type V toxin-antitoxin system endoribonuclease antitoxin GhoS [Shimwellia pseudoproteus]|uniref:type V toxin-antitoxin system endoribonuclease antitoxin GhoS n=1 Tax=Shimwellia pseudoproteus TaxID=570012 RepID=UPI0018EC9474|nr:type V toxin-antitoxin system endoribonuclease antitoxin GhoS [Shimwellia pseudoproteus]MBJ3815586.1 type V toxin-antitoxin system endoribonuclease antitoxin GhoS [Shimwellia pseudoproteus]
MSNGEPARYIVEVHWKADSLAAVNEINNHLSRAGFQFTMTDEDGQIHELGPGTFGITSPLTAQEITRMVSSLVESAINEQPEVNTLTWQAWRALIK